MKKIAILFVIFSCIFLSFSKNNIILLKKIENGNINEIAYNPIFLNKVKNKKKPEETLKCFIKKNKLYIDFKELKLTQKLYNKHTVTLRYRQIVNSLSVFNSELIGVIYKGNVLKFINNTFKNFQQPDFSDISEIKKKILAKNKNYEKIVEIEKGYWGTTPCYRLRVITKGNLLDLFVDGKTGNILKTKSLIISFDGEGRVFFPNPVCSSGDTNLYDYEDSDYKELQDKYVTVTLTDIDSSGLLKNRYVDLTAHGIAPASQFGAYPVTDYTPGSAMSDNGQYFYGRDNYSFEEVNVYYWVTEARKYIESLGFNILPDPIPVNVHYMIEDNSFYSELDHGLHFGDGGVDDAEDGEIILHEFMHAITHYIVPGIGDSWEAGSLDEGLSDYFAASFGQDKIFRDYIGEWDATSYNPGTPAYIRPIKTDRHYPEDMKENYYLTGFANIHWDGVIFSSTLWQIRKAVGRDFDRDVIEALYHISTSTSFQSTAMSVYTADLLNGSNFKETIGYFFYKRGILNQNYLSQVENKDGFKLYFPYAEENNDKDTYLGLINTSEEETTVHIDYIAKEGCLLLKEKEFTLAPGEKYYQKVNPDEIDAQFWITVTSDTEIKGYIYYISKDKTESAILNGINKLSNTIYVPHIAPETDYWNTYSSIINGSNEYVSSITVETHEGEETAFLNSPNAKYSMNYIEWYRDFYGQQNIQPEKNWLTLKSDKDSLAAYQFFVRKDIKQLAALNLEISPTQTLYFPHIDVSGNYWWTGIVFENTLNSNEEISVYAYDSEGNLLDTFSIEMQPYEKTVCLVQNLWTNNDRQFPENTAWIKLSSQSECLIGYQLFGTLPEEGARLLSGINAITSPSKKILFPHIQSDNDFWTGIAIINTSEYPSNITLYAYDNEGNLIDQMVFSDINPNAKEVFLVKNIFSQDTIENIGYIVAESDGNMCGFEISGNLTVTENGQTVQRQDYIAGLEGINLEE